jgi:hypothetical protein
VAGGFSEFPEAINFKNIKPHVPKGVYLYGYRSDEVILPNHPIPDFSLVTYNNNLQAYDSDKRPPMGKTFLDFIAAVPFKPDISHPISLVDGVAKRMAYLPPKACPILRAKFSKFVLDWLELNLTPIPHDYDFNIEKWLDMTNYPAWRKEQIRLAAPDELEKQIYEYFLNEIYQDAEVGIFCKEEFYEEPKNFRGIWARVDAFKALAGPFFKIIEDQLFKLAHFIKKISKNERPQYIDEMLRNDAYKYQNTDFTSFESLFTTDMMDDCEFQLYRYMSRHNTFAQIICRLMFKVIAGYNLVVNKYFSILVLAKRMSGEMNTSLGNGFSNLMIIKFGFENYEIPYLGPVVEGDDSLSAAEKSIPPEYFTKMGLNVKMDIVEDLSTASFCGIIYHPDDMINIRDPREPLATTFWVPSKYAFCNEKKYFELIKSKALSIMFEYPGCPILDKFGHKIFELLYAYEVGWEFEHDTYRRNELKKAYDAYKNESLPKKTPSLSTRILMQRMFDITVEMQLAIENEIEHMTLTHWFCPLVTSIMPEQWISNYNNYVRKVEKQTVQQIFYPPMPTMQPHNRPRIPTVKRSVFQKVIAGKLKFTKYEELMNNNGYHDINVITDRYNQYIEKKKDLDKRMLANHWI